MPVWGKDLIKWMVILAVVSALFAWFGVYGSHTMPWLPRFGFWYMTMIVGGTSTLLIMPWVQNLKGGRLPVLVQIALIALLISVPITASLWGVSGYSSTSLTGLLRYLGIQYIYVVVVSGVMTTLALFYDRITHREETPVETPDPIAVFLERLPIKYRTADLYALSSEDHYLRVHTSRGEELILMRLADALRELNNADGLQTHRSWWVAKAGVAEVSRKDGKLTLILKSGTHAAVSRTYAPAVKAAGF